MKNVLLVFFAFFFLSCQGQDKAEVFRKERVHFENAVEYLKSNYSLLLSSECAEKSGIIISYGSLKQRNCYPGIKKDLLSMLTLKKFNSIEIRNRGEILFELDFIPNDVYKTETTKYYLYIESEILPEQYQNWIGAKEKVSNNWWYLEYTNAQF